MLLLHAAVVLTTVLVSVFSPLLIITLPRETVLSCYMWEATSSRGHTAYGVQSCFDIMQTINMDEQDYIIVPSEYQSLAVTTHTLSIVVALLLLVSNVLGAVGQHTFQFTAITPTIKQVVIYINIINVIVSLFEYSNISKSMAVISNSDVYIGTSATEGATTYVLMLLVTVTLIDV
jgi:hypothetical protein